MGQARSVVYFAYLGDEETGGDLVRRRLAFMDRQLGWLAALVDAAAVPVLVPYVAPRAFDDEVHRTVGSYGFRIDPASVVADRRNRFEYPGFLAMKALALGAAPDDLIYYCHSKGIVQLDEHKMGIFRLHSEVGLSADLTRLRADPALTKAGLFPYRFGWCWYNFFWIKAGPMARLTVEESEDRYHFEALIGRRGDKDAWREVLPLIDRLPFAATGIPLQPWYWPAETNSPTLATTYDRYAAMAAPAACALSPSGTSS